MNSISDELTLVNALLDEDDVIIQTLNGIGPKFKEIYVAIRILENSITFEELHDTLTEYELPLQKEESECPAHVATANYTRTSSHAPHCGGNPHQNQSQGRNNNNNNSNHRRHNGH
ncbi:UBN2 domain-containing protein [Cephalotus follicularis]|uniref:UBN2 domain-containing protein n=1 Tax=Cephalotus follicularis TaxID=3775 RepID=A0A1Q3D4N7_CEPFO|nr:UBN2 domain-containing protein [Cephalotus follicularis]